MKKYEDIESCEVYYVGQASDIKAMYKAIRRNKVVNLYPMFCKCPKFAENKSIYALCINEDGFFTIVNSDTMLKLIINELVKEL